MGWRVVALTALVVVMLAGCSGSGLDPGAVTGVTVESLAADQMTMLALVRGWLNVLYNPVAPPDEIHAQLEWDAAKDAWHIWGTNGWGQPFEQWVRDDSSGWGTTVDGGGRVVYSEWDAPVGWPIMIQHIRWEYPGMTLESTYTMDFGVASTPYVQDGTETLADGRKLYFRYETNQLDQDKLYLKLDGTDFEVNLQVPIAYVFNVGFRPLPDSRATGTMQTAAGQTALSFQGTDSVWQKLEVAGGEVTGTFSLGECMCGSGQLVKNGVLQGALNWSDQMVGRLDLTSLESIEVTPLAAARDLAMDKWISSIAGLTPGAM